MCVQSDKLDVVTVTYKELLGGHMKDISVHALMEDLGQILRRISCQQVETAKKTTKVYLSILT